eukprot:4707037-Alexandrium_andersonii.AAC.1
MGIAQAMPPAIRDIVPPRGPRARASSTTQRPGAGARRAGAVRLWRPSPKPFRSTSRAPQLTAPGQPLPGRRANQ